MLVVKLYDVECTEIEYRATMDLEGETITIGSKLFLPS